MFFSPSKYLPEILHNLRCFSGSILSHRLSALGVCYLCHAARQSGTIPAQLLHPNSLQFNTLLSAPLQTAPLQNKSLQINTGQIPAVQTSYSQDALLQPINARPINQLILCDHCVTKLPRLLQACESCALPLAHQSVDHSSHNRLICGACLKKAPSFASAIAGYLYDKPIKQLISQLKFNQRLEFVALLSQPLLSKIVSFYQEKSLPRAIIPVPLHPIRLKQRGFNQSQLIAKQLVKHFQYDYQCTNLDCQSSQHNLKKRLAALFSNRYKLKTTSQPIKLLSNSVLRIKNTLPQSSLPADERKGNLQQAFAVNEHELSKLPEHVAIVDDVMTTGATVETLSQCLITAGVKKVDVWCVARAITT
ncbi:ComF family protein [Aliikangiella maris]|uniref:ComF family protein n=2 Tax=Aliikangiella maris TaxID=3162458 RepID=A0ABV3MTR9_9GAMM